MKHDGRPAPGEVCLMCGQVVPIDEMMCVICRGPILRGHKFTMTGGVTKHRNCEDPEMKGETIAAPEAQEAAEANRVETVIDPILPENEFGKIAQAFIEADSEEALAAEEGTADAGTDGDRAGAGL